MLGLEAFRGAQPLAGLSDSDSGLKLRVLRNQLPSLSVRRLRGNG
jgi:hypothetical protein